MTATTPAADAVATGSREPLLQATDVVAGYLPGVNILNGCDLTVYPGEVFHNILGGVSPGAGTILRRYADIKDNELTVRLTPTANQQVQTQTIVVLRRLSGADEMLPRGTVGSKQ